MPSRTVHIGSAQGLHARPAGLVARLVAQSGATVTIGRQDATPVNAASLLSIMSLNLQHGESAVLTVEGASSDAVLDQVAELLGSNLDDQG